MRVWRLSAVRCGQRAAGAENNANRPSSLWRVYTAVVVYYVGGTTRHDQRMAIFKSPKVPLSRRLARHSRGEVQPAAAAAAASNGYSQTKEPPPKQATYNTQPHRQDVALYTVGAATGLPQTSAPPMSRRAPATANPLLRRRRRDTGAIPFAADSLPSALQGLPSQSGYEAEP